MEKHISLADIPDSVVVWNLMMISRAINQENNPLSATSFVNGLFESMRNSWQPEMLDLKDIETIQWCGYILTQSFLSPIAEYEEEHSDAHDRLVIETVGASFHTFHPHQVAIAQ